MANNFDFFNSPLVSVVVPVYNGEKYINDLLISLEAQTYQNFEAIFINDGSTDDSEKILLNIVKKTTNNKYKVFTQKNKGVSAARNVGIRESKGKYIAFVDIDDLLQPSFLREMVKSIFDENTVAICQTSDKEESITDEIIIRKLSDTELLRNFLYGKIRTGVCGMLIPAQILQKNTLQFAEGYKYSEDLHMLWRIFCNIKQASLLEAPLYIYRKNQGSAMTKINDDRLDSIKLIKSLDSYISEKKPEFYLEFHKYSVPRMSWSLLWQCAHFLAYNDFKCFIKKYDFSYDMKQLFDYPEFRVSITAYLFCYSNFLYYCIAKIASCRYRRV